MYVSNLINDERVVDIIPGVSLWVNRYTTFGDDSLYCQLFNDEGYQVCLLSEPVSQDFVNAWQNAKSRSLQYDSFS